MKMHSSSAMMILLCLLLTVTSAADARPRNMDPPAHSVILDKNQGMYPLGHHLFILEDTTGGMTIREASSAEEAKRYTLSKTDAPSFGFNNKNYWARFRIVSRLGQDEQWFLELEYPHLDRMDVYFRNAAGGYSMKRSGDIYPFDKREIKYRNFVFTIPVPRAEEQTVYLHFAGNCSKQFPMTLWSPKAFAEKVVKEKLLLGIYYGIILVMIFYNLFLYFFVRDRSYLFYVIYIASYGLVQLAYNGMAFEFLWPSYPGWHNISLPFLIGLAIVWMAIFTQSFLHTKEYTVVMHRLLLVVMGIGILVLIYSLVGNYLIAIQSAMILMVIASIVIISSGFICMMRGYRPARFFLIAWLFFLLGLLLIALNKLHVLPIMFITEYANQIGSALEVTLLSLALADRINIINQEKNAAQVAAIQAQEKYRLLVEGSNDMIYSLDEHWDFITANKAMLSYLKIKSESVSSMNFFDLIYDETSAAAVIKTLIEEKLKVFSSSREPLSLAVMFKSTIIDEPKEMQVRLECINIEGKNEILGKASGVEEDALTQFIDSEQQNITIGNFLMAAEDVSHRLTRNLKKFINQKQANLVRIALREIIINAIEHGNLDISYREKSEAMADDTYFKIIAGRRQDPRFRDRQVYIEYALTPMKVIYRITDEGRGFDHQRILRDNSRNANRDLLAHGRGISMAKNIFDIVQYNEKGNQVTLVKKFSKST